MDLRKQNTAKHNYMSSNTGPFCEFGEVNVDADKLRQLRSLYAKNPSMVAARAVLLGQLVSSGIVVRRGGADVPLKESFSKHLEGVWLPFARACFDELMVQGFVTISIEDELADPFSNLERRVKRKRKFALNKVPVVTEPGSCQLSFYCTGRNGYQRAYRAKNTAPGMSYSVDDEIGVFVRYPPDTEGNPTSPVSTCFESASFVAALQELALQAEVVRARTLLVTQIPSHSNNFGGSLAASDMFYDSESRELQKSDAENDAHIQASSLNMLTKMCARLNQLQSHTPNDVGVQPPTYAPPEVPPRLFTLPEKQMLAPTPNQPQARGDLESLLRQSNESICAAFGVPAAVM
tara:strand:- start:6 stop:1052 length:1047 start_codon:yes stop_codon:yes gene_type:complete